MPHRLQQLLEIVKLREGRVKCSMLLFSLKRMLIIHKNCQQGLKSRNKSFDITFGKKL